MQIYRKIQKVFTFGWHTHTHVRYSLQCIRRNHTVHFPFHFFHALVRGLALYPFCFPHPKINIDILRVLIFAYDFPRMNMPDKFILYACYKIIMLRCCCIIYD